MADVSPEDPHQAAERLGLAFISSSGGVSGTGVARTDMEAWTRRLKQISAELEGLDGTSIWGKYKSGRGHSLHIAPDSGATYSMYGDLGRYDANHGEVLAVEERIIELAFAVDPELDRRWYPTGGPGYCVMSSEWCVVDWGKLRFMIPSSQMIPFCNDVNHHRSLDYPRRSLDPEEPASRWSTRPAGLPIVPARYRPFLLEEPVRASILWVDEPVVVGEYTLGQDMYRVIAGIDAGRSKGLLPGTTLVQGRIEAEVIAVEDEQARVRMHTSDLGRIPGPGSQLAIRVR